MNIEEYRDYCLSLGDDVEERMPFGAFRSATEVLVFYVMGHMFAYFDCRTFDVVSLKCQPERIEQLREQYSAVGEPYNASARHWIGINPQTANDALLRELTANSYAIVKQKYSPKKHNRSTLK